MKKFIIICLLVLGCWQYYSDQNDTQNIETPNAINRSSTSIVSEPKLNFKCDGRQHCSEMTSYEEAEYFNRFCPSTKMDGDNDGIPCERQFNK